MRKIYILVIALVLLTVTITYLIYGNIRTKNTPGDLSIIKDEVFTIPESATQNQSPPLTDNNTSNFVAPVDRAGERVTKKPFGIFITKQNSPVQPEKFSGYHTGTDFETFPEEQNSDVPVFAITDGKILEKRFASGYGGVLVEGATINNQPVTIVYGHLKLAGINKKTGDSLGAGEQIGFLGKGYSQETDGERKHLHLGIHKGYSVNIRGYVNNKEELSGWIDYMKII